MTDTQGVIGMIELVYLKGCSEKEFWEAIDLVESSFGHGLTVVSLYEDTHKVIFQSDGRWFFANNMRCFGTCLADAEKYTKDSQKQEALKLLRDSGWILEFTYKQFGQKTVKEACKQTHIAGESLDNTEYEEVSR